ncbi:MAG: hypothetical protein ACTSV1_06140 [Alphaproteobacteria bacterium]
MNMKLLYRPVSLIGHDKPGFFRCLAAAEKPDGVTIIGKPNLGHDKNNLKTAEKNTALLSQAFKDLQTAHDSGNRVRLIVPINSYGLATGEAATLVVQAFKELPQELRPAVIIEFFDFPKTLTLDILGDIVIPVLPFFDNYMAVPAADMTDFTIFSNLNFFGVALDLGARNITGDAAIATLTSFWAEATKSRLKVLVQGVREQEIADKARQYECFSLDGPVIGEDCPSLD